MINYIKYLVDLVPAGKRKHFIYGPAAFILVASGALLGYDAAVDSFTLSQEALAIIAGVNLVGSTAFGMANYKTTDQPTQ